MIKIDENVFVGNIDDLKGKSDKEWAFVQCTKTVYSTIANPSNYLFHESENRLTLNWVDVEDYHYFNYEGRGVEVMTKILDFIDKWVGKRKVLIHCDKGESRGPSVGLLYLAKRSGLIVDKGYAECKKKYLDIYEDFYPNTGIEMFMFLKWQFIK